MPIIELAIEVDLGDEKIRRGEISTRVRDVPAIYLIAYHNIIFHESDKFVIIDRFYNKDSLELTNIKTPYLDKRDGSLKINTVSTLFVKNVIISPNHVQYVDIYAPNVQLFSAKLIKGDLVPTAINLKTEIQSSFIFHTKIDDDLDMENDENKEKCPYYLDAKVSDVTWECDVKISDVDSKLAVQDTYIYPNIDALKRLNLFRD